MDQTLLEACLRTAKQAGSPKDQVKLFLERGYVPYPWQWNFHAAARAADHPGGPVDIGLGGARGPGKSHAVMSQAALDDCQRVPGLKGLFLRQTGNAAKESFDDLITKVVAGHVEYERSANMLRFPNGSRIVLGGFHHEDDIDKYVGIEYDFIVVEELNQLTKEKYDKLRGSLRTSKPNWRPRMYTSFNPGGKGHLFVKERYVIPNRERTEKETRFVPSTYKQNPNLNREYIDYLESLEGDLGKAWREGDFDLFAGQYFQEWRHARHVVIPFPIPSSWKKFRAYDHGRKNPACCKWYAVDYDGRVWVYRELYAAGLDVDQLGAEINRLSAGEEYEYSMADPAIFANIGFTDKYGGQTIAESFARQGIMFLPASNRRVDGWNLMHQYLRWDEQTPPRLLYFNTCHDSIRTIPALVHDELKPEDIDTDGEDHAADTDRYLLMSLHERQSTRPLNEIEKKLRQNQEQDSREPWKMYAQT